MQYRTLFLALVLSIILSKSTGWAESVHIRQWTKQIGTPGFDFGSDIVVDSNGNIYVTGSVSGELDGNTNFGSSDIFVLKYDSSGTKQWTKQIGTSSSDYSTGIAVDSTGNVYVTGYTDGGLDGNTNFGGSDIFVLKYDSSGTKQWTKQIGTQVDDNGNDITVDSTGNIYITGFTSWILDGKTNFGVKDIFLLKYDSSGSKLWTKQIGTSGIDIGNGVAIDGTDNIYVTGWTSGGLESNTTAGSADIFLLKYDSSGSKLWTKQFGTANTDMGSGISIDIIGNIYVTGYTQGGLDGNTNTGGWDTFLTKYDSSTTKQWTKQIGTGSYDNNIVVDSATNNIYIMGSTVAGLDGNINLGTSDVFLLKYDSFGTKQWTKQIGATSIDYGYGIAIDSIGNIYVTGSTSGGLDGNNNQGSFDVFLIKYKPTTQPTLLWTGEINYVSDGLHPEKGESLSPFTYRINYIDLDNDAPANAYPKLYIKKYGIEITSCPFSMSEVESNDTNYTDGKLYEYKINLAVTGTDYTYYFEAYDIWYATASGTPTNSISGPVVAPIGSLPFVSVNSHTLEFGEIKQGDSKNMMFTISNSSGGTLSGTIGADKEWIKVSPTSFYTNSQVVNVTVDNSILNQKEGEYTGTITVISNGGTATVLVKLKATCVLVYPNPYSLSSGKVLTFWGTGVVSYQTKIKIYTLGMDLVKTLIEEKGADTIGWDGTNESGDRIVPGIYFYTTESPTERNAGRFTVIK